MGEAGGGKSPQAAAKWIKTGRMSRDSMDKVAARYGYCSFWILTGHPPKKPVDIMDATVITPTPPRTGRDVMKAAEPAAKYAAATQYARRLADDILTGSASGTVSDTKCIAIAELLDIPVRKNLDE